MEKRRQLKTRSNPLAIKLAQYLATKAITPNQISLLSMAFGLVGMIALWCWNIFPSNSIKIALLLVAICGIQGRLLCNLIDGMVAVEGGKKTPDGELYNDAPDRISDTLFFVGLGLGLSLPYAFPLGLSAALFAVLTAYVRMLGLSMGTPAFFIGPLAKQHRMALLTGAIVLTIPALFFDAGETVLYTALILINLGALITCVNRLIKIRHFVMLRAQQQ